MNPSASGGGAAHIVTIRHVVPPSIRVAVVGIFLILFLGALFYARDFVLPLVLASLLALTLAPLVVRLARRGIPATLSALMLVGAVGGGIATASVLFSGPFSQMAAETPDTIGKVRDRLAFLREPIAAVNHAARDVENVISGTGDGVGNTTTVIVSGGGLIPWIVGTFANFSTTFAATLLLAVFLLASADALPRKLVSVLSALSEKKRSLRVLYEIENDVSRYLTTVTAINAVLGFLVGSAMTLSGLGNGIVWGVLAFIFNFIPYAGATVGITLVAATSLATFDNLTAAATPPLIYLGLQFIEGSFVTPMILGRRLSLSPIAILTMLSLTTWMWGIVGTVIGVPLLVVLKVFCDQFPSLAGFGVFLSGESTAELAEDTGHSTPAVVPAGNLPADSSVG